MLIPVDKNGFWANRGSPAPSLLRTAEFFDRIQGKIIVEIGSGLHGELSGNSILVWAAKTAARRIIAVDTEQQRIDEVIAGTTDYSNVETHLGDGLAYLQSFEEQIDLLYLDFWAGDGPGVFPGAGRAEAYRQAYFAAREKMNDQSLILIDDTDHVDPWKQSLILFEARRDGFQVQHVGRQTLLRRGAD